MIKVVNSQFSQDEQDSNMMWKYSLSFAAIAPLEDIVASSRKELAKRTSLTSLYSNVTTVMTNIKKYL